MNFKKADNGKVFAYKDEHEQEIILGSIIYLGVNDDISRYYEIDEPKEETENDTNRTI